jgi:hypothetical protein
MKEATRRCDLDVPNCPVGAGMGERISGSALSALLRRRLCRCGPMTPNGLWQEFFRGRWCCVNSRPGRTRDYDGLVAISFAKLFSGLQCRWGSKNRRFGKLQEEQSDSAITGNNLGMRMKASRWQDWQRQRAYLEPERGQLSGGWKQIHQHDVMKLDFLDFKAQEGVVTKQVRGGWASSRSFFASDCVSTVQC